MARHVTILTRTRAEILQLGSDQNACAGMLYKSSDTDQMWFGGTDGSVVGPIFVGQPLEIQGIYSSDADAAAAGVSVGEWYEVGVGHLEGAVEGTPKKRIV